MLKDPARDVFAERLIVEARKLGPDAFDFWAGGGRGSASWQDLCDALYTLYFLGWPQDPAPEAADAFAMDLSSTGLPGGLTAAEGRDVSVHNTAYILATLDLLAQKGLDRFEAAFRPASDWQLDEIVDPVSHRPRWPAKWGQHSWRVSHWVGGTLAILATLGRCRADADHATALAIEALEATDALIDPRTGYLRCYSSDLLHRLFNAAYSLRHDPTLGEIGGVVHVHWVNYHLGRPIKAAAPLHDRAVAALTARRPYMEKVPYCLDFDVVQIARVTADGDPSEALRARALELARDLVAFFSQPLPSGYTLHKVPGALATLHEAALIAPEARELLPDLLATPRNVMRDVCWI